MNISPINCQNSVANSTGFKANLWVDQSVKEVVKNSEGKFLKASKMFDGWLQNEKKNVNKTLTIRKNTSMSPNAVFKKEVTRTVHTGSYYDYSGNYKEEKHDVQELVDVFEDLEFDLEGRKCGFWFDPASGAEKLLSDFKNMFKHLQGE